MNPPAPEPLENMGRPEPRVDGRLKVTGAARYGSDFTTDNPAFAYLVTSPIARGRIERIDLGEARWVRGVIDVFTHDNTTDPTHLNYPHAGPAPSASTP